MTGKAQFCPILKCRWLAWSPEGNGELQLNLPEGECCDMEGVIRVATEIMPNVSSIKTVSGGVQDAIYTRYTNGSWVVRK